MHNDRQEQRTTPYSERACKAQDKHGQRAANWLLAVSVFQLFTGCNQHVGNGGSDDTAGSLGRGTHGPVPGLFAADEAWAVVARGSDLDSGPNLLVRGYGNSIEYVLAISADSLNAPDALTDPAVESAAVPPMCLGIEPRSSSVILDGETLRIDAEFAGVGGQSCKLSLLATVCAGGSEGCLLEDVHVAATRDGTELLGAETKLRLIRLDPCPDGAALAVDGTAWVISSVPLLTLTLASVGTSPGPGESTSLPFPLLLLSGIGNEPNGGSDISSARAFGDGPDPGVGCHSEFDENGPPPSGTVAFEGRTLTINLQLLDSASAPLEKGSITRQEAGVCSVAFRGQVAYCAQWSASGAPAGDRWQIYRVVGEGTNTVLDAPTSPLSSVYVVFSTQPGSR